MERTNHNKLNLTDMADSSETFAEDRDWVQFHTPKNLVMALVGEAGELHEIFQWLTPSEACDLWRLSWPVRLAPARASYAFRVPIRLR